MAVRIFASLVRGFRWYLQPMPLVASHPARGLLHDPPLGQHLEAPQAHRSQLRL